MLSKRTRRLLISLGTLGVGEVIAGLTLQTSIEILALYPVFLMLIPGLMDMRGDVYGALGYRLTTALHIGEAEPRILTRYNLYNVLTGYSVTVIATLAITILSYAISVSLRVETPDLITLSFISVSSSTLVFLILTPVTTISIIYLFKTGRDPTDFVASIVTGVGDALTPFTFITVSLLFEAIPAYMRALVVSLLLSLGLAFTYALWRGNEGRPLFENAVSSVAASFGSSLGGLALATRTATLLKLPLILGSLPAFNALLGAATGIFGNDLSIKLHLGSHSPLRSQLQTLRQVGLTTFTAIILSIIVVSALTSTPVGEVVLSALILAVAYPLIFTLASLLTYYLTKTSFTKGWNPDNIVFPLMTTFVDLTGPIVISSIALTVV